MGGQRSLVEHGGEFEFGIFLRRLHELFRESLVNRDGLLDNDMLFVFQSFNGERNMEIMRRGDDHGVNIRFPEELLRVGEELDLFGIVAFEFFRVDVANRRQLRIGELSDADDMGTSHVSNTDNTDFHLVHGRNPFLSGC